MSKFSVNNLSKEQKKIRKRILEISHESHLAHIGSCLGAVDLIDAIYKNKKDSEEFILSNGHAGIALYVILEKYGIIKSAEKIKQLHIHPDRNKEIGISVSTGSLGQGLPIAVGMAIADRKKNVYCMLSDGECAEGSIWEALRLVYIEKLTNMKIVINANGWSAYDKVNLAYLVKRLKAFGFSIIKVKGHAKKDIAEAVKKLNKDTLSILFAYTVSDQFTFLKGQDAHYYVMKDADYELAMKELL